MSTDRDSLPDRSGSHAELDEILGKPMTAEDWVESAGWWIERGGALPEASPMFKALVDVVQECQRRSADLNRLQAENERLRGRVERTEHTLAEIQGRDWWENALDPQWAATLSRARLKFEALHSTLESALPADEGQAS